MSKKTQAIYSLLDDLTVLQNQLSELKNDFSDSRKIDDISFKMSQDLKTLRFWFDSIYAYNGKSKSAAKKTSSRENGKKGGRPPKKITLLRRRRTEIEEIVIPELEHRIKFADNNSDIQNLQLELEKVREEQKSILQELDAFSLKKEQGAAL